MNVCLFNAPNKKEKNEERIDKNIDLKLLKRYSVRVLPSICIHQNLSLIGGITLNYATTRTPKNISSLSNQYIWRDFNEKRLRQLYWGWTVRVQYHIK